MIDSWTLLTIGQVAAQVGSQYSKCGENGKTDCLYKFIDRWWETNNKGNDKKREKMGWIVRNWPVPS